MLTDLNEMLARHQRGEDPQFDEFMARHGDFFPEQPGELDELLETLARRAGAMQALLDSMTPEQRDELFRLSEALLDDAGLRDQISQLGEHLRGLTPDGGWPTSFDFTGRTPSASAWPRNDGRARRPRSPGVAAPWRHVADRPRRGRRRAGRRTARR